MQELTKEQIEMIETLKTRWSTVTNPVPLVAGDGCVMVTVSSENTGVSMVLGIETDGHCHS